ncbi:MAG: ABC transporter ATP-binding protein [Bdellovibrionota bacterium]
MSADNIVNVIDLQTTFYTKKGPLRAVNDVSYTIGRGETLGIVGESGCGKSVTSYSLMGLIDPPGKVTGGQAFVNGEDVLKYTEKQFEGIRGQSIAMIFQEPMTALNPVFTVGYQMDEQIMLHMKLNKKQSKERAVHMLDMVGIPAPERRYYDYPHQLSGGMRQRAMIAMALSCNPSFLIADEPTTALDVTIQAQILELIQELQEKNGMTVQFITHDLAVVSQISDHVMIMYAGKTCEYAKSSEIFSAPAHPYTKALLQSIPKIGQRLHRLPTIDGSVPSLLHLPKGCAFQNRCPNATAKCKDNNPELKEIEKDHLVACFNPY